MREIFCLLLLTASVQIGITQTRSLPPPNILWISWEDVGPHLGAYGDEYAITPNLDELASEGFLYTNAYSNYPVCAMARSTIITGQYASSYGGQNMRCRAIPEEGVHLFPELLRKAGYYCTNDAKTDYQIGFDGDIVWDRLGHVWSPDDYTSLWKGKAPGQPFFTVINLTTTHEGHSRTENKNWVSRLDHELQNNRHDPSKAPVPPYLPDSETTRQNIALYYDNITYTDSISGIVLDQLAKSGMDENTIVVFWGDHGWGLPRGKRWPYQSGLQVPLVVRVPEKYQYLIDPSENRNLSPGAKTDELVSFVDFAPTMLSLAGVDIPDYMQGKAFLGEQASEPQKYVFGGRGRMDETYDCMRTVIDKDYLYIRNFMWYLPYVQTVRTMERHAIMQELRELHKNEELTLAQSTFFQYPKPVEELYDLKKDPHQIHNLAGNPEFDNVLQRFREENHAWMMKIRDVGLITEPELDMMKWPDGLWPETAAPVILFEEKNYWNGQVEISMESPTNGAGIAWKPQNNSNWHLYTKPVVIGPNQVIQTKAARPGFYSSPVESFWLGKPFGEKAATYSEYIPWQKKVNGQLLDSLLSLKKMDIKNDTRPEEFFAYLNHPNASMRYWAVVGIHSHSSSKKEMEKARTTFLQMAKDPSAVVRIEAAYALCKSGDFDNGIPVLREAIKHRQESVRLYALNHLDKMGEKARMALPFPEIPAGTANNYSHRIMIRIYKRLGIKPQDLEYATPEQVQDIQRIYNTIELENLWDYGF